jgi:hypothetical protein
MQFFSEIRESVDKSPAFCKYFGMENATGTGL